jgi:regulator of nucleoside diphosphate kinase
MTTAPSLSTSRDDVVITELDFDRLSRLTESPLYRATHATLVAGLRRRLDRGRVMPARDVPKGAVTMRSRVRVRDLAADRAEVYTIVYPDEADVEAGRLSVLAPLAMALLGARAGQTVEVTVPAGVRRLRVDRVLYQPEAAGHLHL